MRISSKGFSGHRGVPTSPAKFGRNSRVSNRIIREKGPMTNEKDIYGAITLLQTFLKNLEFTPKRSETFIDKLLPELLQRVTHKQAPEQFLSALEQNANKIFLHLQIPTLSEEATTRQKAVLGKYYQVTLPEHPSSATPDLRLLYETTLPQEEIEKIFQLIARNKEAKDPQVAAFLGPPGCGKTSGLFQIALKKFVTFFDCQSAGLGTDNNYFQMCSDIGNLPDCTDLETFSSWHANNLKKAKERVLLEYCARRIHLLLLLTNFPTLESKNYLESQLNGGRSVIKYLVSILKTLDISSVSALLDIVDEEIHSKGVAEDVVAIDEAGAAQYEQGNRIVSESALKSGALAPSASLKGEIIIPKIYKRGILGALTRTLLEKGNITVILASPDIGVREYDSLGTTLGKAGPHFVVDFKKLSREEHIQFFKKHFYIPEQAIKYAYQEARSMFPSSKISCIVSIGTGLPSEKKDTKHQLLESVDDLKKAAVQTELTNLQFAAFTREYLLKYYRLNPPLQNKISLYEYDPQKISLMLEVVEEYVSSPEISKLIDEIILLLKR